MCYLKHLFKYLISSEPVHPSATPHGVYFLLNSGFYDLSDNFLVSVHWGPTVPLWQMCLVHLILIHVYSHEQLILKMFVNTRVLCVLLKPGADKYNHYSIIFSFCTISFRILTCHLCLAGEAAAHADEIQPAWNQRHGAAWMSGAGEPGF